MDKKPENPQAFLRTESMYSGLPNGGRQYEGEVSTGGMTLRDYFAGQALMGAIAASENTGPEHIDLVADVAYKLADAMLKARQS